MRRLPSILAIFCLGLVVSTQARASLVFMTNSTATQTVAIGGGSPQVITATGTQTFTIDLVGGTAFVASDFHGNDLNNPFGAGTLSYDLYNTPASTTGTVTQNLSGTYNVSFSLLFELKITTPGLAGETFETHDYATFAASNIAALPFPSGTAFSDPVIANDPRGVFVKTDVTGLLPPGTLVGVSLDRVVTIDSVITPEPSSVMLGLIGVGAGAFGLLRKRSQA